MSDLAAVVELQRLVGTEAVLHEPEDLPVFEYDGYLETRSFPRPRRGGCDSKWVSARPLGLVPGFSRSRPRFTIRDPPSVEALSRCIQCGLCQNVCPTFRELRVETESPRRPAVPDACAGRGPDSKRPPTPSSGTSTAALGTGPARQPARRGSSSGSSWRRPGLSSRRAAGARDSAPVSVPGVSGSAAAPPAWRCWGSCYEGINGAG